MFLNVLLLFVTAFGAGIAVFLIPELNKEKFKAILSFSGAYLFSITVIHILPELFHESSNPIQAGIFVLMGFFLQMMLEYFTSGVEHGHIHHSHETTAIPYLLLVSLGIKPTPPLLFNGSTNPTVPSDAIDTFIPELSCSSKINSS